MAKRDELQALIAPVVATLGYQLWGIDYLSQGRNTVLRVYIDSENGINVDDCANVSRQVSALMDVEDPIHNEYTLEVSSPGMDRPLYNAEQYEAYRGHQVQIRLRSPFEGRRKFSGVILGVEDGEVIIRQGDDEFILPLESIERGVIVPVFDD